MDLIAPTPHRRLPDELIAAIRAEAGTMTDAALAAKYSALAGFPLSRHRIFYLRTSAGTPAAQAKKYTKPVFNGRLEDAYPEIKHLVGLVEHSALARHYGVSRSTVRAAARRLKADPARQLEKMVGVLQALVA